MKPHCIVTSHNSKVHILHHKPLLLPPPLYDLTCYITEQTKRKKIRKTDKYPQLLKSRTKGPCPHGLTPPAHGWSTSCPREASSEELCTGMVAQIWR